MCTGFCPTTSIQCACPVQCHQRQFRPITPSKNDCYCSTYFSFLVDVVFHFEPLIQNAVEPLVLFVCCCFCSLSIQFAIYSKGNQQACVHKKTTISSYLVLHILSYDGLNSARFSFLCKRQVWWPFCFVSYVSRCWSWFCLVGKQVFCLVDVLSYFS